MRYRFQDAFRFQEVTSDEEVTAVTLRFAGDVVYVVENDGDLDHLRASVDELLERLRITTP